MSRAERCLPVYLQSLKQSENLGEEILADQQQVVELDNRRQINRQALRAVKKEQEEDKMWVMMGTEFVKVDKDVVESWLENDQTVLDKEIDGLRDGMKDKVSALKRLEGKDIPPAFYLNALSKNELSDIGTGVGRVSEKYVDIWEIDWWEALWSIKRKIFHLMIWEGWIIFALLIWYHESDNQWTIIFFNLCKNWNYFEFLLNYYFTNS